MQTVVEVIAPGPLAVRNGHPVITAQVYACCRTRGRLIALRFDRRRRYGGDTATRARAEAAVQRAIRNWREQEQQHSRDP